jgi:2',3'-cyclic-nucleotide 2'-phosphodiesterase (5'-nucleotidase family)
MNRFRSTALLGAALALLLGGACAPPPQTSPAAATSAVKRLRVVHTNDIHGRIQPQPPRSGETRAAGGAAVLGAHFDSAAARFPGATIFLSAGDDMQGTAISNLSWGRATIAAFNAMGYDVAATGNHEFDWGQDTLRARMRESRFPWLAANLYQAGTGRRAEWVRPWTIIERRGVRVGVVGVALPNTPEVVVPGRIAGLEFRAAAPAIDQAVREVRAAGVDFVVVTMHIGAECRVPGTAPQEESRGCSGEMLDVARALAEPVDLVVGGHTHLRVLTMAGAVPVVEAMSYSSAYSVTDLERSAGRTRVTYRAVHTPYADEVTPDTAVERVVREWEANVRPLIERVVLTTAQPLINQGRERPLGNLLADAFRRAAGAQASIINNGSIRRGLPGGPVNYGVLYEMQPFQNAMYRVEVSGAQLRAALENAVSTGRPTAHISGMTVAYDSTAPEGSRIRSVRMEGGRELGDADRVTLGLSEFMAEGGDRYTSLAGGRRTATGLVDLNVLIDYLLSLPQPVQPAAVGRWRKVG